MAEPVTYFNRDGEDFAVFAFDLEELIDLRNMTPRTDEWRVYRKNLENAIEHLASRKARV